jgi:hypothetical protein
MATIQMVLKQVEGSLLNKEDRAKTDWKAEGDRCCLKQATINFIVNLCNDKKLREHIASNMGGILLTVFEMLKNDVKEQQYDWCDSVSREVAVCINAGLEVSALKLFSENGVVKMIEDLLKILKFKEPEHKEIINRTMNVLAKVAKVDQSLE